MSDSGTEKHDQPEGHQLDNHSDQKVDDPSKKYSFSSYHMNIISGNQHVQGYPVPQVYQAPGGQYGNYFPQPQNFQSNQYASSEIQTLLNNMFMVLNNQSKLLAYLIQKNEHNFQTTSKIYDQVKFIKKQQEEPAEQFGNNHFKQINYNADITPANLISILYGAKATFKYKLIIDSKVPFETPLYRERNFKLKMNLIDENGKIFSNSNKIPISLALYTVQNPPKFLESNTLGNKMLKGYTEQDLYKGVCSFEKIQIKEVTSHYRKNMLFLVAFAKVPSLGCIQDDSYVDYQQICPLVIDRVVVKAKKMKNDIKQKQLTIEKDSQEQGSKILQLDEDI